MIQRYHFGRPTLDSDKHPYAAENGLYIRYSDHEAQVEKLRADNKALLEALRNLCDSLRKREGSKIIHVNHDELMELISAARAAIAHSERQMNQERKS